MARYKSQHTDLKFLPIDLREQLLPGTFEHTLNYLLEHELDLSRFDKQFNNDEGGAPAYAPKVLLKVILFAYSRGLNRSRDIERACRENVVFIALSGDSAPHFTTIAGFIRKLGAEIGEVFSQVLAICDHQGLIGRDMFAIDGVKLPSNAAKSKSGSRADFQKQVVKYEKMIKSIVTKHQQEEDAGSESVSKMGAKNADKLEKLRNEVSKLKSWLKANPEDRKGSSGAIIKSNRTDNESAKMATAKGVDQGYCAVAAVDQKNQIIMQAEAYGSGNEHPVLIPLVEALAPHLNQKTLITADAGYHSEENLRELKKRKINALIADNQMRKRDERFADQRKYKEKGRPLHNKSGNSGRRGCYQPSDFYYDAENHECICPAGKRLNRSGEAKQLKGKYRTVRFKGTKATCVNCPQRNKCITKPDKTAIRQVSFIELLPELKAESATEEMRRYIDSPEGRALYSGRMATVEPVFANIRYNKRLTCFTLRGKTKVDTQWKLYCLVHNIEKLANYGNLC